MQLIFDGETYGDGKYYLCNNGRGRSTIASPWVRRRLMGLVSMILLVTLSSMTSSSMTKLTVIGIDSTGTEIIKITSDKITIRPDPEGDWVAPPPSVVEDAINQMAVIQAATIAAKNETERLRDEAVQNMEAAAADIVAETEAIRDAAAEFVPVQVRMTLPPSTTFSRGRRTIVSLSDTALIS